MDGSPRSAGTSMLYGVTELGEVDQQRRMHAHFLLMWLDTSGHPATRNTHADGGGARREPTTEHASAEP